MKILEHGIFYYDTVKINCKKCNCKYEIKKEDVIKYIKPKKVEKIGFDYSWKEKYEYYTRCPECDYDNELEYQDYEILTTKIKEKM